MTQTNTPIQHLLVIDSQIADWQSLATAAGAETAVLVLERGFDGLTQISDYLTSASTQGFLSLQSLQIMSHGSAGSLLLGSGTITSSNLSLYSKQLAKIASSLTDTGDILLYGCDVAAGSVGLDFINQFAVLTGADVAASFDVTGSAALGGNWQLEANTGPIEAVSTLNVTSLNNYASSLIADTAAPVAPKLSNNPELTMRTNLGTVVFELNPEQAPVTVANILAYVDIGFYDNTLFHRVINNFMVQAGSVTAAYNVKVPTYGDIVLESNNGLSNLRGTLAMARTNVPDSASSQFFVNQVDNKFLDYTSTASPGYAVFGKVISGLSIIDSIAQQPTRNLSASYQNLPVKAVVITSIDQTAGRSITNAATLKVSDLEVGALWSYSLDNGTNWLPGSGNSFIVPVGDYAASAIQVRQTDATGNVSASAGKLTSALVVEATAPTVIGFNPADGNADVALASHIVLTFSETIHKGTGLILLHSGSATGAVIESFEAASSNRLVIVGNTLTIDPSSTLASNAHYFVTLASGSVKDLAGNSYAGTNSYDFTTVTSANRVTDGNDVLVGTLTSDTLNGGKGADSMTGGLGNDIYFVDNTGDRVIENKGAGTDTVYSSVSYILGTHIENLTLLDKVPINGSGNALNNKLIGNSVANKLSGLAGNDILNGGLGKDKLTGGAGKDVFDFNSVLEIGKKTKGDLITDFSHKLDKINLFDIDANSAPNKTNDTFKYIDEKAFTGKAGELHFIKGVLSGDTNGDKVADFDLSITVVGGTTMIAQDFVL